MTVAIGPFLQRHAPGVAGLILPVQRDEFGLPITPEDQPNLGDTPGFYQRGAGQFWVAETGDRVVGTIALLDIGGCCGAFRKMFVYPAWRGSRAGTAQRLLDTLLAHAAGQGLSRVYLGTTARFLAAHRFYERNGFGRIEAKDLPASFPRMAVDTRFYVVDPASGGMG